MNNHRGQPRTTFRPSPLARSKSSPARPQTARPHTSLLYDCYNELDDESYLTLDHEEVRPRPRPRQTARPSIRPLSTRIRESRYLEHLLDGALQPQWLLPMPPPRHVAWPPLQMSSAEDLLAKKEAEDEGDGDDSQDESKYPRGWKLVCITASLMMAVFVVALDQAIIATAIPKITSDFDSINDVGWYGSAYLLTGGALQPTGGKVYAYFSMKWTFLMALFIFEAGSVLCAAAPSSVALILGRAVAGAGAGAIFTGGMMIVGFTVPLKKRPIYIATLTSMFALSSIIGPLLGGVFTDSLTWRWCFWINLPIGGLTAVMFIFVFREPVRQERMLPLKKKLREMDFGGAALLTGAVLCLLLALQWGGSKYPWSNSKVWGCLLGFGLLIIAFAGLQIRLGERATLPPRILSQRTVAFSTMFMAAISMSFDTHVYYLPWYFQAVRRTTAEGSGIHLIPYLVASIIASLTTGALVSKFGIYVPFMHAGACLVAVGAGLLTLLKPSTPARAWMGYEVLTAFGVGACLQVPFVAVQNVLSARDLPTGTALVFFGQTLGSAVAITAAQNILLNRLVPKLEAIPGIDVARILAAGAEEVGVTPAAALPAVLAAYDYAVTHALLLPVATATLAFVLSLGVQHRRIKAGSGVGVGV